MQNNLVIGISQNPNTFKECRTYMVQQLGKTKEQVLELESSTVEFCVPIYIKFLEYKGLNLTEVLYYYYMIVPDLGFWKLILTSINGAFGKIEQNDLNFIPY